jgi:hypothetical protein
MQQIHQALKRKKAQLAKLAREIELLQQAENTLREIAPLLAEADADEEDSSLLVEVEDEATPPLMASAALASTGGQPSPAEFETGKPVALRWP